MTTPTAQFPTILTEITIDHGPEELLAPLFLRLEHAVRQLGLRFSFSDLDRLSAINAANRASWMPLFPVYRPDYWSHAPSDAFVLLASEPDGRPIATLAVRIYDWPSSTFHAEATSLRLFYGDVERFRGRGERCEVSASATHRVTGRVALAGAVWVHPDWRKHARLMVLMPRFARAYALARWGIDFYTLLMTEAVFNGGLTRKTGMGNVDWSVDMRGSLLGNLRLGFLWMNRSELHEDLSRCLLDLSSEIDVSVKPHRSQQPSRS
jgi:hypothetical protein